MNKKGSLMYISISDLFSEYLKNKELGDYEILVISQDIITDVYRESAYGTLPESRYKNIDFVPSLFPHAGTIDKLYDSANKDLFFEAYRAQITRKAGMLDICAIVDMVIHEKVNVLLVCTDSEMFIEFFEVMRDVIDEYFSLYMISYKEFKQDPDLLYNYGDDKEIESLLSAEIVNLKAVNEMTGTFINKFTTDMVETLRTTLMNKTVDELYKYGLSKNIHVNRRRDKEEIVNHILKRLLDK